MPIDTSFATQKASKSVSTRCIFRAVFTSMRKTQRIRKASSRKQNWHQHSLSSGNCLGSEAYYTSKILGNEKGELKDHFITATKSDLNDPNINICCGVRWLFQKKIIASKKLKRDATWDEAVFEYKGLSMAKSDKTKSELITKFQQFYERLKTCKK